MTRVRMLVPALAAAFVMALGGGSAWAYSNGGGNSANAPGQVNAHANCHNAFVNQDNRGVSAGGGPKAGEPGPLNCDHFYGAPGKPPK